MINLTDLFSMIGTDNCLDVATSLAMQGLDSSISIPVYDIFYLRIMGLSSCQQLADNMQEYGVMNQLAKTCGGVAIILNVLDMDILTLVGAMCVYTPSTGMNVFGKVLNPVAEVLDENMVQELVQVAKGINIPILASANITEVAVDILNKLLEILMDRMNENLSDFNVQLYPWERLLDYYLTVKNSGEMFQMNNYRVQNGASTIM